MCVCVCVFVVAERLVLYSDTPRTAGHIVLVGGTQDDEVDDCGREVEDDVRVGVDDADRVTVAVAGARHAARQHHVRAAVGTVIIAARTTTDTTPPPSCAATTNNYRVLNFINVFVARS